MTTQPATQPTLTGTNGADGQPETERENYLHLARRCWPGWEIIVERGSDPYNCIFAMELSCSSQLILTSNGEDAPSAASGYCMTRPLCKPRRHRVIPVALWVKHSRASGWKL